MTTEVYQEVFVHHPFRSIVWFSSEHRTEPYFSFPALLPTFRVKLNYELSWVVLSHLAKSDYILHIYG